MHFSFPRTTSFCFENWPFRGKAQSCLSRPYLRVPKDLKQLRIRLGQVQVFEGLQGLVLLGLHHFFQGLKLLRVEELVDLKKKKSCFLSTFLKNEMLQYFWRGHGSLRSHRRLGHGLHNLGIGILFNANYRGHWG